MEIEFESDEEVQLEEQELSQLTTAVLEAEKHESDIASQCSTVFSRIESQDEYSKIQKALIFNKLTDEKFQRLEGILLIRLQECRQKLKALSGTSIVPVKDVKVFRYLNCGKPYFKTKDGFAAPDNQDAIVMAKSHMYDFSDVTMVPDWTIKDKTELSALILKMSIDKKKTVLLSKIAQVKRESKGRAKVKSLKYIDELNKEIDDLKNKRLSDIALPINEEYDWDLVATKLSNRHKAQEYRSFWKLFLHPSINQNSWFKDEHMNLQTLAHMNRFQDWEKIAAELNTGRTGYQCFVYYRTNLSNSFAGQKWSKEEEEYLKRLVEHYKEGDYIPWSKIASLMEIRTKIQIYNKYARLTEQRKGRFLPEEDAVILTGIKQFGKNFKKISKYLPGRSVGQLRTRYHVLSNGNGTRTSTVWTVEEDKKLVQFMANQDSTLIYASLTKHFPGKDRSHIRTRYLTLAKWMKNHPNMDLSRAPRRGSRRLNYGPPSQDLNKAVENLKNKIKSEVEQKKSAKTTIDSSENEIETAIIATLINDHNRFEELKQNEENESTEQLVLRNFCNNTPTPTSVANLTKVLILLKAKLKYEDFLKGPFHLKYPELSKITQERCILVKSYSKKQAVQVVKLDIPDIWGNRTLSTSDYALPPNYSTITGCRTLLSMVTAAMPDMDRHVNFGALSRRNVLTKEELDKLIDCFSTLFLWPMLLSNESPNKGNNAIQAACISTTRKLNKQIAQGSDPHMQRNNENTNVSDSDDDD